jgi:hypothetical protein
MTTRAHLNNLIEALKNVCTKTQTQLLLENDQLSKEIQIYQGVRQGCVMWLKKGINVGYELTNNLIFNVLAFGDDLTAIQENEDLQKQRRIIYAMTAIFKSLPQNQIVWLSKQKTQSSLR